MNLLLHIFYYTVTGYYTALTFFTVYNIYKQKDSSLASEFIFFLGTDKWFAFLFLLVGFIPVLNILATLTMLRGLYTIHKESLYERRFRQGDN